jgi:hypothetical protein
MDIKEVKQQIRNNVKFESINPPQIGGQSCGMIYSKQRLYSEELDLTIETGHYRSQLKNRNLLFTLFDLALDDLIR